MNKVLSRCAPALRALCYKSPCVAVHAEERPALGVGTPVTRVEPDTFSADVALLVGLGLFETGSIVSDSRSSVAIWPNLG